MKSFQKGHVTYIILSAILVCFFMYYMEQVLQVTYAVKTITKISVFLLIPSLYYLFFTRKTEKSTQLSSWTMSFLLAVGTFCGVWIGYILFGQFVDFNSIQEELQTKSGITQHTFIWVSLYVVLGNSFLEEYFFRGFIFKQLLKNNQRRTGYLVSSFLFAIYHVSIFESWFSWPIMSLILIVLVLVGFLFNYLTERTQTFFGSWIVHASADLAIILIAYHVFQW